MTQSIASFLELNHLVLFCQQKNKSHIISLSANSFPDFINVTLVKLFIPEIL